MKLVFIVRDLTDEQKLALKSLMRESDRYMVNCKEAVFAQSRSGGNWSCTHGDASYAKAMLREQPNDYVLGKLVSVTTHTLVPDIPEYIMQYGHKYVLSKE